MTACRVHRAAGFLRPYPVDQPIVRLVVFHHAGGSAAAYFPLARAAPPAWDVVLADFPGRGRRHRHPAITDMAGLVGVAVADTLTWAGPPIALFGHSLGAIVAAEVARAIQDRVEVAWVGVSGRPAPAHAVPSELDSPVASDDRLMAALARLGGLPDRIDELPGFRDQFLRVVRDDLAALRSYRPGQDRPPITAPVTAFGGTADALAPPASIAGWAGETVGQFRQLLFDGGHFYFTGCAFPGFAQAVREEIQRSLSSGGAPPAPARERGLSPAVPSGGLDESPGADLERKGRGSMQYTHVGRSGLLVSRLCLGTVNFGPLTAPPDAHVMMDEAHELGINFFDTANAYGRAESPPAQVAPTPEAHVGWSEEIIGDWFATGGGRRERTVLATKGSFVLSSWPNDGRLSALSIRRACEDSLRRLRTDYIDVYQMHHIDRDTPWEEIWQAMEVLISQGKVLYVGSSNFAAWNIAQASDVASARGMFGLVSEQSIYNLLTRHVELEVLPAVRAYGIGFNPWFPLNGGILGGVVRKDYQGRRRSDSQILRVLEPNRDRIGSYEDLCAEIGEEPARVAIAWLLHQEGVTAPVIGPRTLAQLQDARRAVGLVLDGQVLKRLDELFPGYQPAPEHYAW